MLAAVFTASWAAVITPGTELKFSRGKAEGERLKDQQARGNDTQKP